MVTDCSGTSILSNEFVVIGRASTDNLGVLLGPHALWPIWPQVAKSGSKNLNLNGIKWSLDLFASGQTSKSDKKWPSYGHPILSQF